jgi:hypothetical protein
MNRSDFTSSNGNRNDKRNQGAASCGARAEQHHITSIDFVRSFGSRYRKAWSSKRAGVPELVPIICGVRASPGDGTVVGTNMVPSHSVLVVHD